MGKRVNFSSRTVITPDASMDIDCLGVPEQVAAKQTVPERVTRLNLKRLTRCVRIGGGKVGGASKVHMENGRVCNLSICSDSYRKKLKLKPGMMVERHLSDDDWVVFNRQPTLHTGSMMGHRVKIMKGLTFRLPVPDTTPYNADFDGDEMNMHTPQDVETAAEVQGLMSITSQMLGAQSNSPIIGCVQDTTIGLHLLTRPGTLLNRALFMDLLSCCHHAEDRSLPLPAVLKPRRIYTGLQAVSTPSPRHPFPPAPAKIRRRSLHATPPGVRARRGAVGRCSGQKTRWARGRGAGPRNLPAPGEHPRGGHAERPAEDGGLVADPPGLLGRPGGLRAAVGERAGGAEIDEGAHGRGGKPGIKESTAQDIISKSLSATGALVLESVQNKHNMLNALVESGSKGSVVNLAQILGGVGQQSQSGGRVCREETLTSFAPDSTNVTGRGFCASSYTKGLSMEELFMHTVSGREGLIDTASQDGPQRIRAAPNGERDGADRGGIRRNDPGVQKPGAADAFRGHRPRMPPDGADHGGGARDAGEGDTPETRPGGRAEDCLPARRVQDPGRSTPATSPWTRCFFPSTRTESSTAWETRPISRARRTHPFASEKIEGRLRPCVQNPGGRARAANTLLAVRCFFGPGGHDTLGLRRPAFCNQGSRHASSTRSSRRSSPRENVGSAGGHEHRRPHHPDDPQQRRLPHAARRFAGIRPWRVRENRKGQGCRNIGELIDKMMEAGP